LTERYEKNGQVFMLSQGFFDSSESCVILISLLGLYVQTY